MGQIFLKLATLLPRSLLTVKGLQIKILVRIHFVRIIFCPNSYLCKLFNPKILGHKKPDSLVEVPTWV
jgi:hypothetical protein